MQPIVADDPKVGEEMKHSKGEDIRRVVVIPHWQVKQLRLLPKGSPVEENGQIVTQAQYHASQQRSKLLHSRFSTMHR